MVVLGIETSGPNGGVALVRDGAVVSEECLARGLLHGRNLVPALEQLLTASRTSPADLHLIAVTRGPGSHTGIRIGLMAARTLAYSLQKPLVGIHALDALCRQAPDGLHAVVASIDARLSRVFGGIWTGRAWSLEPGMFDASTLAAAVPEGAALIGTGTPELKKRLGDRLDLVSVPEDAWKVQAASVALLGAKDPARAGNPAAVEAVYFR